jgi:hypothetical protein
MKALFICKKFVDTYGISYGLNNSAQFVVDWLKGEGYDAVLDYVTDSNGIDRLVTQHNPTHVVIQALWVPPSKFEELLKIPRHRDRVWIVRIHSRVPFLANEGIAIDWIYKYNTIYNTYGNPHVAPNSENTSWEFVNALGVKSFYLPNVYYIDSSHPKVEEEQEPKNKGKGKGWGLFKDKDRGTEVDIGCFGAIRPMKNQLAQAMAAIVFADSHRMNLHFHMNTSRTEQRGDQVYRNIKSMFVNNPRHELVEHTWLDHDSFMDIVSMMDFGMQVSLTESFNIVTADFVSSGIPMVVSQDIEWMPSICKCSPNSIQDMVDKLNFIKKFSKFGITTIAKMSLNTYNKEAKRIWLRYLVGSNT